MNHSLNLFSKFFFFKINICNIEILNLKNTIYPAIGRLFEGWLKQDIAHAYTS
jgi:hypothetical protein